MSDERSFTRRQSLLGIGAAGTALGGATLAISNVMAGDEDQKGTDDTDQKGDDETKKAGGSKDDSAEEKDKDEDEEETHEKESKFDLELLCYEEGKAKFRVHNDRSEASKVNWKVDAGGRTDGDTDTNGDGAGEDFDPDGETIEDGQEVDDDDDDDDDDNGDDGTDDTNGYDSDDQQGKLTVPKSDTETFWASVVSKDATAVLFYDGKVVDSADVDKDACKKPTMADKIDLEAVCYRMRKTDDGDDTDENGGELTVEPSEADATATYTTTLTVGDDNDGDSLNDIVADFQGTGVDISNVGDQDVTVERNGVDVTDDLDEVSGSNDGATLTLGFGGSYSLEAGDEITVSLENVQNPEDAGEYDATYTMNSQSAGETTSRGFTIGDGEDGENGDGEDDAKTREAKFCVYNGNKTEVKVNWMVNGDDQGGKLYIDGKQTECVWVTATDGRKTTVTVVHDGEEVDTKKADLDTDCDDHDDHDCDH